MAGLLARKQKQFDDALASLKELFSQETTDIVRDATIQRFEYSVEAFWKLLKTYISEKAVLRCIHPRR